jgi:hypothetical protein
LSLQVRENHIAVTQQKPVGAKENRKIAVNRCGQTRQTNSLLAYLHIFTDAVRQGKQTAF